MFRFIKKTVATFITQIGCLILVLIGTIIITRNLGPEGKGIISLLTNYVMIVVSVFTFGMSEGVVYYLGTNKYSHKDIYTSIIYITIAMSLFVIGLSIFFKDVISRSILKNITQADYYISLAIVPSFYFFLNIRKLFLGHKDIINFNLNLLAQSLLQLIFYLIFIPIWQIKGAILSIIAAYIIVDIFAGITAYLRHGGLNVLPNFNFLKDSFLFGMKSEIGIILNFFERRLDIFIINFFLDPASVGFYTVAVAIAEFIWRISDAIGTVLFPEVASLDREKAIRFIAVISRNFIFAALLLSGILFLIGRDVINILFGMKFMPSLSPLRILLPGVIALGFNRVLCGGFSGLGKPEYGTYTVVFSAITTVILDLLLIPKLGINGAAIASTIAYICSATTAIVIFKKAFHCRLSDMLFINKSDLKLYLSRSKIIAG
ncbi:MAG: polysaccharide biosynthesis C-terminal domain-containing protein [candidate division WOR-3 bacterium]